MTQIKEIGQKLKAPFPAEDIEYRVVRVSKDSRRVLVLPYITSRAVMNRLDEVLGNENWYDEYDVRGSVVICRLSISYNDKSITKEGVGLFVESFEEASSVALFNAAVKYGIGRELLSHSELYADIMGGKPECTQNELHYYQSDELSGWWIEPEIIQTVPVEDKLKDTASIGEKDFRKLDLAQKLDHLLHLEIISKKKYDHYFLKVQDKTTASGLIRYFERQFDLLHRLYLLAGLNKMSDDTRATIYKRIMSSKMAGFVDIENELKELEEAA